MAPALHRLIDQLAPYVSDRQAQAAALALVLLLLLSVCAIFRKAGFSAFAGLLMLVPVVNVFVLLWLAAAPWPARRELRHLRRLHRDVQRADERWGRREAA